MHLEIRRLGTPSLEVSPRAFGYNVFGGTIGEPRSSEVPDASSAARGKFIDTAAPSFRWRPGNHGSESEPNVDRWMKARGNPDRVSVATKVGTEMGPDARRLARRVILKAVEDSLARLQTDPIALYPSHEDEPATPIEKTLETSDLLACQGKARAIGASDVSLERPQASLDIVAALDRASQT